MYQHAVLIVGKEKGAHASRRYATLAIESFAADPAGPVPEQFEAIIELAAEIKAALGESRQLDSLRGRIVALLFQTPSTRTRVSFESATLRLGGSAMYLQSDRLKLGGGEPVEDTARVLSEYCDAIVARVWPHSTLVELAEHSLVPVVNACTDVDHPTQAICDLFTVYEAFGPLAGLKMTFVGTGNNMCSALMLGCAMAGMQMSIACPPGFEPEPRMLAAARDLASTAGAAIEIDHDAESAVANADVIYTDIWEVPGRDDLSHRRRRGSTGRGIGSMTLCWRARPRERWSCTAVMPSEARRSQPS